MNPAAKILLFLLALPFLLAVCCFVVLPLLFILLIASLLLPSVRVFRVFRMPGRGPGTAPQDDRRDAEEDSVLDVECTVMETSEEPDAGNGSSRPPELKP